MKNSIAIKSILVLILTTTLLLVANEVASLSIAEGYKSQAEKNYRNSLQMNYSFWDKKMGLINNSLAALGNDQQTNQYYWDLCYSNKELDVAVGKTMLRKEMLDVSWNYGNDIVLFTYIPNRNIYIRSSQAFLQETNIVDINAELDLNVDIKNYLLENVTVNSTEWSYFTSGNNSFFIQTYQFHTGYLGALVKCDTVLSWNDDSEVGYETYLLEDETNNLIYSQDNRQPGDVENLYRLQMEYMPYSIGVDILHGKASSSGLNIIVITILTILFALVLLAWNIRHQLKYVLGPLNKLKNAMLKFSSGNLDTRLAELSRDDEISVLYGTFNYMAEQTSNLKIRIYESEIERGKIQRDYLRLQIQPHFYTNILNLINGMAQMRDYQSIQQLSIVTGAYFRYLIGRKGTFVEMKEEINCIDNYLKIQKIRYGDELSYDINADSGVDNQMVIPLVMQTFVENCIIHNITLVPVLEINIRVILDQNNILIQITDNGTGFDNQILDRLNNDENIGFKGERIGIVNAKERLRLFYQGEASVRIQSSDGLTSVYIKVPRILSEEESEIYSVQRK